MIYLNNAATSFPKPQNVTDALQEFLKQPPCHSSRSGIEHDIEDLDFLLRTKIAKLFNSPDPTHVLFSSGSTESLNLAIKGCGLEGGHVVSTCIEHNSVIRPLKTMELEGKIELTFVPCNETAYVDPAEIENAIKPNTKAIVMNHCSNVTGTLLDLKTLAAIAHKHNCLIIVDASQSAGVVPIDFEGWGIDMLAFTGHKSLYGMPGTGGLIVREGIPLKPFKIGGTGILSEILTQPDGWPIHYEAGTPNMPGIASLNAGIDFINEVGMETMHLKKKQIVTRMIEELKNVDRISIYNDPIHSTYANFCFNIEGIVPEEVNYILESSYEINVRSGLHCAPLLLEALGVHPWGTVRASPSYFSTDEEIDKFIDSVEEICKTINIKSK